MRIIDMVGNTPLITLSYFSEEFPGVSILAKAEFMNPSGSVKDRAAKAMILDGIARGKLTAGKPLLMLPAGIPVLPMPCSVRHWAMTWCYLCPKTPVQSGKTPFAITEQK
ncbi:pyridoxal-phosphate dependent enzyme [Yersinia kristensenii]|uniref:pyridoxal-phosphate dependent enzyme n=1 Tax=Yersinia kristensenii TaxID=28152 RepID=UPI00031D43EF|nr:pyridoxal-phosphate dependent enzyme [Yersinia kristensenii]